MTCSMYDAVSKFLGRATTKIIGADVCQERFLYRLLPRVNFVF